MQITYCWTKRNNSNWSERKCIVFVGKSKFNAFWTQNMFLEVKIESESKKCKIKQSKWKIHWAKWSVTRVWKSDLKSSRSGLVECNANKMDLWFLVIAMINSPENIPGQTTFTPFCATRSTLSLYIFFWSN